MYSDDEIKRAGGINPNREPFEVEFYEKRRREKNKNPAGDKSGEKSFKKILEEKEKRELNEKKKKKKKNFHAKYKNGKRII